MRKLTTLFITTILLFLVFTSACSSDGPSNYEIDTALSQFSKNYNKKESTDIVLNEIHPIFKSKSKLKDGIRIETKIKGRKLLQSLFKVDRNNNRSWLDFSAEKTFIIIKDGSGKWVAKEDSPAFY